MRRAEEVLRGRGLWDRIDRIVWAGKVSRLRGHAAWPTVRRCSAPFFVVRDEQGGRGRGSKAPSSCCACSMPGERPTERAGRPSELPDSSHHSRTAKPHDIVRFVLSASGQELRHRVQRRRRRGADRHGRELGPAFSVFCLDTGRLHPETYAFIEKVRKHYGIENRAVVPTARAAAGVGAQEGPVQLLRGRPPRMLRRAQGGAAMRALSRYRAWITGQRRDQSPTRADVESARLSGSTLRTPQRSP